MESTITEHLAKAQLYRWYQFYEREMNEQRVNNQMEILCDDIAIKTPAGEMQGKQHYPGHLETYKGWKNAHHVQNVSIGAESADTLQLEADIHYQNIRANGQKSSYSIHYTTLLKKQTGNLPQFSSIQITPTGETNEEFLDSYPANRVKSLMHYWLALTERLDGNVTPYEELLAEGFELNFATAKITSNQAFEKWLHAISRQLDQSSYSLESFSVKRITENEYEAAFYFDWKGISKEGGQMKGRTKHLWYVLDKPNDRFAKILRVEEKQIEPYKTIEE